MKKNKVLKRIAIGLFSFIGAIVGLLILMFAVTGGDEPKEKVEPVAAADELNFDEEEYNALEAEWIQEKQGSVIAVKRDDRLFDVQVNDLFHELAKHEKENVAEAIYKELKNIAISSELIKPKQSIDVVLIDSTGNTIASKNLTGKWNIEE